MGGQGEIAKLTSTEFSKHLGSKAQQEYITLIMSISSQSILNALSPASEDRYSGSFPVHEESLLGSKSMLSQRKVSAREAVQFHLQGYFYSQSFSSLSPASPILELPGCILTSWHEDEDPSTHFKGRGMRKAYRNRLSPAVSVEHKT